MANTYDITQKLQAIADAIENGGGGGGGGTTVIANPTGTPTADLNTIQIGQTIYDIPGGGGGGNVYDRTVLATPNTVTPGEISLSDNINNFDDLEIIISFPGNTSKSAFRISADYFMTEFPYVSGATPSDNHLLCCLYDTYYVRLIMGSANNKMYMIETSTIYLEEIAGIKYISRGGGSDQAIDINYDNTTSGLTADNVQDAIDENADNISTLNSKFARLLWTNPSPSVQFAPTTITLSDDDYDALIIVVRLTDSDGRFYSCLFMKEFTPCPAQFGSYARGFGLTDSTDYTKLTINNGYNGSSLNNYVLIPQKIYGLKLLA